MAKDFVVRVGLSDYPDMAAEIGHLTVAWACVEFRIYHLFETLTGLPPPLARSIYYSQRTTRARLDLVLAVSAIVLRKRVKRNFFKNPTVLGKPLTVSKKVSRLLGDIGNLAGQRNKFVHDPWASYPSGKRCFQLRLGGKELHGDFDPVRIGDIERLTLKLETKVDSLVRLIRLLRPRMPPLLDTLELHHELTLVSATKSTPQKSKKAKPQSRPRPSRP
jgi:hypothetical protein